MKVKDKTKIFTRICLAIILAATAFMFYKLHFKGSDVWFINSIDETYTITVEKEASLIDNSEYKRLHLGDEYTTYLLKGENAVNFRDYFSSLKIRKLLKSSVGTKHVEDFVYYRITITDAKGNVFYYKIGWIEVLEADEVEAMKKDGDWDLTLFTCTYGGGERYTIRCIRNEK